MATQEKLIDVTMLDYYDTLLRREVASQTDFDTLSDRVDDIVAEGGEPNVIETVKVNGTALTPDAQKAVNVETPVMTSEYEGSVTAVIRQGDEYIRFYSEDDGGENGIDIVFGGVEFDVATVGYVDLNSGKIDTIKVNGTAQTITDKAVDITVPTAVSQLSDASNYALVSSVPTAVSALTNDSGYQTEAQVQALIDSELEDITGIDFQVVDSLPATGEKGVIYLVHKGGAASDIYDEYIWVTPTSGSAHYEMIGTTDIDLSGYWDKETYTIATTADIDAIFA